MSYWLTHLSLKSEFAPSAAEGMLAMTSASDGDRRHLTGSDAEWEHAHIFPFEAVFRYSEAFKMAAEVLVDHVYASGDCSWWADSLFYPVGYLLRHYIELKIKSVLSEVGHDLKKPSHKLLDLWRTMREVAAPVLPAVRSDAEQEEMNQRFGLFVTMREDEAFVSLQQAEEIVTELHDLDPSGEAFRYAFTKNGARTLPETLTHVDLKRLLGRVLSVGALLEGIETAIDQRAQWEADMREYYAEEMREYDTE